MKKITIIFGVLLAFTQKANATIISDAYYQASDTFVSYDKDQDGVFDFDIILASSNAYQFWDCNHAVENPELYYTTEYSSSGTVTNWDGSVVPKSCENQLFAPSYIDGDWDFFENISGLELDDASDLLTSGAFKSGGIPVTGFELFNTNPYILSVDFNRNVISNWISLGVPAYEQYEDGDKYLKTVFYAREHVVQAVSEPSVLAMLMLAGFGLFARSRKAQR